MSMIEDMEDTPQTVLRCRECSAPNLRQQNFCVKCGTPLWQSCLQCGSLCAVGEHYCGSCGANLEETAANQVERVESEFRCVGRVRSACRFEEAMARLVRMTKSEHPGLAEYVARAKQLILEVGAERDRRRAEAEENYELARERLAAFDVGRRGQILGKRAAGLAGTQNGGVSGRGHDAPSRRLPRFTRNCARQSARIVSSICHPRSSGYWSSSPTMSMAGRWPRRYSSSWSKRPKNSLAEHQYDQALRLLEQIAPHVRTQRAERLHRQVEELAWLAWDLRNAPVVDATLLAVAERLRRLAPRDERAGKLCAELQRRARLTASQGTPLPWARPPRQTPLGVPVEWLTGFRRIRRAESLEQPELVRNRRAALPSPAAWR